MAIWVGIIIILCWNLNAVYIDNIYNIHIINIFIILLYWMIFFLTMEKRYYNDLPTEGN